MASICTIAKLKSMHALLCFEGKTTASVLQEPLLVPHLPVAPIIQQDGMFDDCH